MSKWWHCFHLWIAFSTVVSFARSKTILETTRPVSLHFSHSTNAHLMEYPFCRPASFMFKIGSLPHFLHLFNFHIFTSICQPPLKGAVLFISNHIYRDGSISFFRFCLKPKYKDTCFSPFSCKASSPLLLLVLLLCSRHIALGAATFRFHRCKM